MDVKGVMTIATVAGTALTLFRKDIEHVVIPNTEVMANADVRAIITMLKNQYTFLQVLPNSLILAIVQTESDFRPGLVGSVGEIGMMQVKPTTGAWIREVYGINAFPNTRTDPIGQLLEGMLYLHWLYTKPDMSYSATIHAYNVGYAGYKAGKRNWSYYAKVTERSLRWSIPV